MFYNYFFAVIHDLLILYNLQIKRLQSIIKDRDAQFKHELKKKEREVNKLKEKLHQLISDKTPNRRVGQ